MSAAIYYHGDAYSTAGPKLMGRNAAGESFLRGFAQHSTASTFWAHVPTSAAGEGFAAAIREAGRTEPVKLIVPQATAALREAGVLYYPASPIATLARERSLFSATGWSLCGITHTTASQTVMDGIAELAVAPVQPWDAVICTSAAVRANVEAVLAAEEARLAERLGTTRTVRPQLPVIPLGIHCDDFVFPPEERVGARERIGADASTLVVLFAGRLSFHAKAHPAAMYEALERAAAQGAPGQRIMLIECGWFANETIRDAFDAAAGVLSPSVTVVRLDGRVSTERRIAWAGADVFCSLADNVQETFGLTPIEAMAAGLPVVVSDWDGYRDTVRDGVDGFRIATMMPRAGLGGDLAARHALGLDSYDRYCGYSAAFVAVDIAGAAGAFAALFASPELRARMGAAGRTRARADYDWAAIIPRYEVLWAELRALREAAGTQPGGWPARMDPFAGFAGYATAQLTPDMRVALAPDAGERLERMLALEMVNYVASVLPAKAELDMMLATLNAGPQPAAALVAGIPPERQGIAFRAIAWLMKIGVVVARTS